MIDLSGIFPPLPTSFDKNDELSLGSIKANIKALSVFDISGFLILGSNGELINLSEDEKAQVYMAASQAIPKDKLMLAGTGGQSTTETLRLTLKAADAGADAALILNPSYYKGLMVESALVQHYHEIADKSPIPIIIYNMPANSGIDMDADMIIAISKHHNIIGLKDSGGNLTKMANIIEETDDDFQVLAGSAGFLLPALSIGAVGGILALANIAPLDCISIFSFFKDKEIEKAAAVQRKVVRLNTAVTRAWGVPALKAAMDHLGLFGGECRKPIQPLDDDKKQKLFKLLESYSKINVTG